jgi:hypothetical protein
MITAAVMRHGDRAPPRPGHRHHALTAVLPGPAMVVGSRRAGRWFKIRGRAGCPPGYPAPVLRVLPRLDTWPCCLRWASMSAARLRSVTDAVGGCRAGRGTLCGAGSGRIWVQCVHSGHAVTLFVQAERPEPRSGPLLIRGFGVRVPGGAPVLTSAKPCPWPVSLLRRGATRSAASLHMAHHRRTRTVITPVGSRIGRTSHLSGPAVPAASRPCCAGKAD